VPEIPVDGVIDHAAQPRDANECQHEDTNPDEGGKPPVEGEEHLLPGKINLVQDLQHDQDAAKESDPLDGGNSHSGGDLLDLSPAFISYKGWHCSSSLSCFVIPRSKAATI
jgi:hypothetical protein